ncbi:MAG: acyl-CoA dehydrogenase family protein [Dehalococcoidia bacterium]|jgi:alkylation response protein AidB-like acyl-CoA dehydrogenase
MQATEERSEARAEHYLDRVRAILDDVRSAAAETEANRCLSPRIVDLMTAAGTFNVAVPQAWGGLELDPVTHARGIELLAQADASAGWCAMIGCDTGYASTRLDDGAARELFADLTAATVYVASPTGAAVPADGGYTVTGRWTFASGSSHAKVFCLGTLVMTPDGPEMVAPGVPAIRVVAVPRDQVEIIDTWTTTGLRGSASHDVAVTSVFVPAARTFALNRGRSPRTEPLYQLPTLFVMKLGAIPLGIARGAIDDVLAIAARKRSLGNPAAIQESQWLQLAVANAEWKYRQSRAFYYEAMQDLWDTLARGDRLVQAQTVAVHLSMVGAMENCTEVVDAMYRAAGSASLYARHTLDRRLRDIHTAAQHTTFSLDRVADDGKALLGIPVKNSPLISVPD